MLNNNKFEIFKKTSQDYNNDSIRVPLSALKNLSEETIQVMLEDEISAYLGYEYHNTPNERG